MKKIKAIFVKGFAAVKKSASKVALMAAVPFTRLAETSVNVTEQVEQIKGFFSDFTVANLAIIIGGALALGVVLFLFWFAYRFIKRAVVKALKKGQI